MENLRRIIAALEVNEDEREKVKEMLRESEEKLRNFIESSTIGIWCFRVEKPLDITLPEEKLIKEFFKGVCVECNETYARMMSTTKDEILGTRLSEVLPDTEENREYLLSFIQNGFKLSGGISHEVDKKGNEKYFSNSLVGIIKDGKSNEAWGTQTDITEQKKAEEKLRKSKEEYRALFEFNKEILMHMPIGIIRLDTEMRIQYENPELTRISGLPKGKLESRTVGKDIRELPGVKEAGLVESLNDLQNGKDIFTEFAFTSIYGKKTFLRAVGCPIREKNQIIGSVLLLEDITERKKAERALRDSEKLFRSVVEHSHDGIFIVDSDYRFIYVNNELCRILGYPCKEIIGHDFRGFLDEESKILVSDRYVRRQKGEEVPARYEFNVVRKDGKKRCVEIKATVIKDSEGSIQTMAQILDITERKQAEEALEGSEEKYRTMIEHSNDLIWTLDKQGRFTFFNKEELSGYKLANWVGKNFAPIIVPEYLPRVQQVFLETLSGKSRQYEVGVYRKDGTIFVLSVNTAPIYKSGEIVGTVSFGRDITERKQAEEALSSEKERLTVTLHSIGDGVISTNIEGRIVLMNKVAENLTGWTQEETIGKPICEVFHIINKETRKPCEDPVKRVIEQGGTYRLTNDTILISRDGRERIIADSGAPIRDKESKVIGVVLVFRDITEKQKMEEELQKMEKLESLGVLAGGIAHDFNNILTGILGNVTLAKLDTDPGDEIFQILAEAEKATTQAKNLTHQLLTFSRGGAPLKKTVYIGKIIKDSANFALSGSNVTCVFSIPEDLLPVKVDEGQISQVINNLIINADQAMPEGGAIKVELNNITVGGREALPIREGKYVKIIIEDHGVGIPGEHLQKIFDPYFTTKQKGSGLGLATAFSIVKQHDGYITVESKQGTGTTFSIYLSASVEGIKKEKETKEAFIPGRGRVLLVDDEKVVRDATGRMLKKLGYDVEFAREGNSALELYKEAKKVGNPFDAVIMDLTIPGGMGGEEAIQKLLKIDPKVRAIVSSGYSTDPIMANYKDYGFEGVIVKPYKAEELSEILHRVIED